MSTPVLKVQAVRALEARAQASLAAGELMQRAGRSVAKAVIDLAGQRSGQQEGVSICVVCGPGNNGGDGYVAAGELRDAGHRVVCIRIGPERPASGDAVLAFRRWTESGGRVLNAVPTNARFDVVVDALLGIGVQRALEGDFLAVARWINRQPLVCAIDVPSGLDADRGTWVGDVEGARADATITLIADKPGLHTADGVDAAGTVLVDSLGLEVPASNGFLSGPADFPAVVAPRLRNSHKGQFGTLAVIGGAASMVGAALLAGRAGLRLGAGRVVVELVGAPQLRLDLVQPELMLRAVDAAERPDAIVIGCGLGLDDSGREALTRALARSTPLVIDADALTLVASNATFAEQLCQREGSAILTPHPLEAARLLGTRSASVQSDRVSAALELARRFSATVVLKGAGSVIAGPGGSFAINPTGSPALATAGSGDVLAGMLGAFVAQGHGPWQSALAAVWLHGRAAEGAGDVGLVAGEIAARAVEELRKLRVASR